MAKKNNYKKDYSEKKDYKKNNNNKKKCDPRDEKSFSKEDKAEKYSSRKGTDLSDYVGSSNDPHWYMRNERLIKDAAKIATGYPLGSKVSLNSNVQDFIVPGIMALRMVNTPGVATQASDGVNLAAAGLFQFIRKNLSTVATYAPADTMMYVLGIDDIYSMYANILRAFGIVNAYSALNYYMPDELLKAGYDFSEEDIAAFKRDINSYRSRFNNLIYKASTLYLPTDFTITSRHSWLYSNYFTDGVSLKSQIYIHSMAGHHLLDETSSSEGTKLRFVGSGTSMTDLLDQFEAMIEAYRNSDSMIRIGADMRRAFEGRSMWKLAYCDEGYMVLPSYSEEVLSQIHNITILSDNVCEGTIDITQSVNKNILLCQPQWPNTDNMALGMLNAASTKLMNFKTQDVTTEQIVEATRNMVAVNYDSSSDNFFLESSGPDLCLSAYVYVKGEEPINVQTTICTISDANSQDVGELVSAISMFEWAPIIFVTGSRIATMDKYKPFANLENWTMVDNNLLRMLNDNIMCSMWSIPEFGGFDA